MGLTPKERQRDLFVFEKLRCERDLAEIETFPQPLLESHPNVKAQALRLKMAIAAKIENLERWIKNLEGEINEKRPN